MFWKILQNSQENTCEFCEIFKNIFLTRSLQELLYKSLVYNANKCQKTLNCNIHVSVRFPCIYLFICPILLWHTLYQNKIEILVQKYFWVIEVVEWLLHLNVSLTVWWKIYCLHLRKMHFLTMDSFHLSLLLLYLYKSNFLRCTYVYQLFWHKFSESFSD